MNCSNCHTINPATARFCMSCGHALQDVTPADDAGRTRLAAATPALLAEKVRSAGRLAGERRMVTILFADVVGSAALAQQLGPETWAAVMSAGFERLVPAVYRYEGTIAGLVGDALIAFFGAPVAHEDDPLRAVRAALDLIAAAGDYATQVRRDHGVEFAMRACLNTGPVAVGPVGANLTYEYTAIGGEVDLAARVKFAAPPMSVVITGNTQRFVAPLLDVEDLGPIRVSGAEAPLRVYRVIRLKTERGQVRGLAPVGVTSPMVGRDAELAALLRLSTAVRTGLGRAALIVGEPGLGKSRLIAEWEAAVARQPSGQSMHWAEGRCLSYGQKLPYHLLADLLRSLLGTPRGAEDSEVQAALLAQDGELGAETYPSLAHLLSLPLEGPALEHIRLLDAAALQAHYLAALRRLLGALARRRPLVLVLEDLHWADPSSVELLVRLLPLAQSAPLLFCLITRPDRDAPGWRLAVAAREEMGAGLTELTLSTLSEADTRQLVSNLLKVEALPEPMRRIILGKAEGNPFFVEEVIRMLIDRGVVVRHGDHWMVGQEIEHVDIPDNLQGLLLARIDRLPDDVRHTLRVAAVIGRQFPVRILAEVLRLEGEQSEWHSPPS